MPTVLTHALLPLIGGMALGRESVPPRLVAAGMVAAVLPDFDVIGFRLGIPYGADFGHRGASHSMLAALLMGLAAMAAAPVLRSSRIMAFAFVALAGASHGLADMLTNGGRGIALWWPLSGERLFFPVRPIEVSAIGARALGDGRLVDVLISELIWLLIPAIVLALLYRVLADPHIDLAKGQS